MKFVHNKIDGTFVIGISFSNYFSKNLGRKNTSLIFDLGSHSDSVGAALWITLVTIVKKYPEIAWKIFRK